MFIEKNELCWSKDFTSFFVTYFSYLQSSEGLYEFRITDLARNTFDLRIIINDQMPLYFTFTSLEQAQEAAEKFIQISESNGILFKA